MLQQNMGQRVSTPTGKREGIEIPALELLYAHAKILPNLFNECPEQASCPEAAGVGGPSCGLSASLFRSLDAFRGANIAGLSGEI